MPSDLTTTELRAMAVFLATDSAMTSQINDAQCNHIWNAHRQCQWCHRDRRDVYADELARHILANTAEDDDEPYVGTGLWEVNEKRLSFLVEEIHKGLGVIWCPQCGPLPPLLCINSVAIKENPIRGDVRRLLSALRGEKR